MYQDHLNTHTRIEPYECQHGHKKFTGRYRRNEHEKVCNGSVTILCLLSFSSESKYWVLLGQNNLVPSL
jgi:hypothetical protein